ncbi:hypothetical protein C0J29_11775 [Mycobacterium paragordonae]|uniref:DUF1876 domain-containing protein n=2 Tax=Mycobacterium paragordonae TaxID=1389713 RepID=A0ABQ1C2P7_9MYCO|nr:hypothetical protein [Mycobacterium paragordonae]AYE95369.1 hypothetical protein C0J29_11775 [Mycobacterium paragordonae]GFG78571.1 hypothetical protein MPRG_18470 [Mycobacterium paragordonae]
MDTMTATACTVQWCKYGPDCKGEHWTMIYTPATHRSASLMVGCGVDWNEADDGNHPSVVVHIDGGSDSDVDTDAHLGLSQAIELRGLLDRAIAIASEVVGMDYRETLTRHIV